MTPVDVGNLLIVFIVLVLFLLLVELGIIRFPSKRKILKPRKWEFWKVIFSDSGLESKIEWVDLNYNGRMFIKHKAWIQPIFVPLAFIEAKTLFPDSGKMLYVIKGMGADGMKSFDSSFINSKKRLSIEEFWKEKEKERTENVLKENQKQPNTSLERIVSDSFNEDYAENVFMEKIKIAQAQKPATKKTKRTVKEVEERKERK